MTMPHLMNCAHSEDGWCLECVRKQWEELDNLKGVSQTMLNQVADHRGNEHWRDSDERAFRALKDAL